MRPAIGGEKVVLSPQSSIFNPQSSVLRNAQKQCFCSQKLDLRHFSRECRQNLNIRTLRIKFRNRSDFEDSPQLVPACHYKRKQLDGWDVNEDKATFQIVNVANIPNIKYTIPYIIYTNPKYEIHNSKIQVDGWDGHEDESKQKWTFLGSSYLILLYLCFSFFQSFLFSFHFYLFQIQCFPSFSFCQVPFSTRLS